jgi:hypothetical protein
MPALSPIFSLFAFSRRRIWRLKLARHPRTGEGNRQGETHTSTVGKGV